jgi:hypothetical protein
MFIYEKYRQLMTDRVRFSATETEFDVKNAIETVIDLGCAWSR